MTVESDLASVWSDREQARDTFAGRATLENCSREIINCDDYIADLVASGNFGSAPVNLRQALNAWWTIIKAARAAIEADPDIQTVLTWTPPNS